MLCILLGKVLYICYKDTIFVAEIKQNTNSTDPRRSLKSQQETMKILSIYKKEEWAADEITSQLCLATMRQAATMQILSSISSPKQTTQNV